MKAPGSLCQSRSRQVLRLRQYRRMVAAHRQQAARLGLLQKAVEQAPAFGGLFEALQKTGSLLCSSISAERVVICSAVKCSVMVIS